MKPQEMIEQSEKFAAMAEFASNEADRTRFLNLSQAMKVKAQEAITAKTKKKIQNLKTKIEKTGTTFADWLKWADSLYERTPDHRVISRARQWEEQLSWQLGDADHALLKVAQLVGYKIYDRQRGRGDIGEDLASIGVEV